MDFDEFQWDDENEAKIDQRLGVRSVDSLLDTDVLLLRNKRQPDRPGRHRLVGRDFSYRWIQWWFEPVSGAQGLWRPITGWPSTAAERNAAR